MPGPIGFTPPFYGILPRVGGWPNASAYAPVPPIGDPLSAYYDISKYYSLIVDSSNRVSLISDVSGNSAVNALCLLGTGANYASVPDSAAVSITGDIDLRFYGRMPSWTTGQVVFIAKENDNTTRSFRFYAVSGVPRLMISPNGTTASPDVGAGSAVSFSAFTAGWVRVTWRQSDGLTQFFQSTDGSTWTQVGSNATAVAASIFDSSSLVTIGTRFLGVDTFNGNVFRAQMYNGIAGTLVLDVNFAEATKLATSFVCATGQTVSVAATGDLGARISGERDLYQGTVTKQPIYTSGATPYVTFDGTDDYMKAPSFLNVQPLTNFFVGQQVTWTSGDIIFDGNTVDTMDLIQTSNGGGATPRVRLNAGSFGCIVDNWTLTSRAIITTLFNGASSQLRRNLDAASTGDPGSGSPNGLILGAGATPGGYSNATLSELAMYSSALSTVQQDQYVIYASQKWGILV